MWLWCWQSTSWYVLKLLAHLWTWNGWVYQGNHCIHEYVSWWSLCVACVWRVPCEGCWFDGTCGFFIEGDTESLEVEGRLTTYGRKSCCWEESDWKCKVRSLEWGTLSALNFQSHTLESRRRVHSILHWLMVCVAGEEGILLTQWRLWLFEVWQSGRARTPRKCEVDESSVSA